MEQLLILNSILISIGIVLMAISSYFSIKIYKIFAHGKPWFSFGGKLKKTWSILPIFIIFFLLGYVGYLIFYLANLTFNYQLLTAAIFFLGAMFVLIIVVVHYQIFNLMGGKK
jgi:hypothetical protein